MKESADQAVKSKVDGVVSEQGKMKEMSPEMPKNYGHDSVKSAGVGGKETPGGKGSKDY